MAILRARQCPATLGTCYIQFRTSSWRQGLVPEHRKRRFAFHLQGSLKNLCPCSSALLPLTPTHQLQFLVGVQGGAFTLRPFLHPLQDVLGTGESALGFFVDGRSSSPTPCVAASPRVPAASHGCDTPTKRADVGQEKLPPTRGPSVAHKPCLALR